MFVFYKTKHFVMKVDYFVTGLGGNKLPKQQTPVTATKPAEEKEEMVMEIKEEVTEIEDSEALS